MAYCTQADISMILNSSTLIALTDQDDPPVTIDATVVAWAITSADNLINSSLAGSYTVPLATTPALVKDISVDLAIYNLYARRPETGMVPDLMVTRYKDRLKQLNQIVEGVIAFPDLVTGTPAGSYKVNKSSTDRIFSSSFMDNY